MALGLALTLTCAGCSAPTKVDLSRDEVAQIAETADCAELQRMEGDPYFYGPAIGFNCFLGSSTEIVAIRYYDDPNSVTKVIDDWRAGINEQNQLVYTDKWFATGPAPVLEELFRTFLKPGPQSSAPPSRPMTNDEQNLTLCSSVTYEVMLASASGDSSATITPYFENYPGMEQLRDEVLTSPVLSALREYADDDDLRGIVFLTQFDDKIKGFLPESCGKSPIESATNRGSV
jgi:hypothetical protein